VLETSRVLFDDVDSCASSTSTSVPKNRIRKRYARDLPASHLLVVIRTHEVSHWTLVWTILSHAEPHYSRILFEPI